MSIVQVLTGSLLFVLASGLPPVPIISPASTRPGLVEIFAGTINLGEFSPPIPIAGGQRIGEEKNHSVVKGHAPLTI